MRVAIVSVGQSTLDRLGESMPHIFEQCLVWDLDGHMCSKKDATKIASLSGQHTTAQRRVFSEPKFADTVQSIVDEVLSDLATRSTLYFIVDPTRDVRRRRWSQRRVPPQPAHYVHRR